MIKFSHCYLVVVRVQTHQGRHSTTLEEVETCATCPYVPDPHAPNGEPLPAAWTDACETAGHKRKTLRKNVLIEAAPAEAEACRRAYAEIYRSFDKGLGLALGRGVLVVPAARKADLDARVAAAHALVTQAVKDFKVCALTFRPLVTEVSPTAAEADTLETLRQDALMAVQELVASLATADGKAIKEKADAARDLAALLEASPAQQDVKDAVAFADKMVKALRAAAHEGDAAVTRARELTRTGAARFAKLAGAFEPLADASGASTHDASDASTHDASGTVIALHACA